MINEVNQLSEREREILRLVATGLSNQQIANQLGISINTVKVHLRNVFGKIGVASRTEATMYAVRAGIVTVESAVEVTTIARDEELTLRPQAVPAVIDVEPIVDNGVVAQPPEALITAAPAGPPLVPAPDPHSAAAVVPASVAPAATPVRSRLGPWFLLSILGLVILVLGGLVWASGWLASDTTSADAATSRWKMLPAPKTPRAGFALAAVSDQLYVIGGENQQGILNSVERYDLRFETWAELSKKPTPVADVDGIALGGKLYVPGGRISNDSKAVTDAFERYDPRSETWEQLPKLPQPRSAYALAALEGKLYLFGGWDGTAYRHEVFEYDPGTKQWSERTPMSKARAYMEAVTVGDSIYVLGGENDSGRLSTNEVYSPAQEGDQPWARKTPMPQARSRFGAAATAPIAIIYAIGGDAPDTEPIQYNVRTDSWQVLASPQQPIGSQPGVIQQDVALISLGGKLADGTYSGNMQAYQALSTIFLPRQ